MTSAESAQALVEGSQGERRLSWNPCWSSLFLCCDDANARFGRLLLNAKKRTATSFVVHWTQRVSQSPTPGDRLQSNMKEDDDMTNLLSMGVKFTPNLVTRIRRTLQENFQLNLTNSQSTLQRDVFSHAIACGHHSK